MRRQFVRFRSQILLGFVPRVLLVVLGSLLGFGLAPRVLLAALGSRLMGLGLELRVVLKMKDKLSYLSFDLRGGGAGWDCWYEPP